LSHEQSDTHAVRQQTFRPGSPSRVAFGSNSPVRNDKKSGPKIGGDNRRQVGEEGRRKQTNVESPTSERAKWTVNGGTDMRWEQNAKRAQDALVQLRAAEQAQIVAQQRQQSRKKLQQRRQEKAAEKKAQISNAFKQRLISHYQAPEIRSSRPLLEPIGQAVEKRPLLIASRIASEPMLSPFAMDSKVCGPAWGSDRSYVTESFKHKTALARRHKAARLKVALCPEFQHFHL
jgi:hypothetical protein